MQGPIMDSTSSPQVTFIYPIIRDDFIYQSLNTLAKYTDRSKYKVIIVDQTLRGIGLMPNNADMVISMKNQGFATGANTGIIHALRWGTPYIAVVNDDTEFISPTWLEDALEEFKTDPNIIAVNPMCPKIAMWGYGLQNGEYLEILPYKENFTPQDIVYLKEGNYNRAEIEARTPYKIPDSFPFTQRGVVDGIAGWLPIFKREGLIEKGLYDERFVWGGGEDYDLDARIYSCAWPPPAGGPRTECDPKFHRRAVSTMKSWVWHHWGKSKDDSATLDPQLFTAREPWNRLDELWSPYCDPWGHTREDHKPLIRDPKVYIHTP